MAVLELQNVVKRYGESPGVGPVSFKVGNGEFLSLLGPSGCGKTTTLRCVAGLEDLSAGTIRVDGVSIDDKPPHKRDIGMVFQQHALFPHLTVFDNLAFGLKLRKISRSEIQERVRASLQLVKLEGFEQRYPQQMSGGQQQRVALARTLVMEPSLLLFDEPLSNLDLKLRIQMRNEIKELHRKLKKTSLYVTHDQSEALALSDRIAVMNLGKIEQIGSPKEIFENPQSPFVADFIGESNICRGRLEIREGSGTISVRTDRGLMLRSKYDVFRGDCQEGAEVYIAVRQGRILLAEDGEDRPNLLSGRIEELMYMGEGVQLMITTEEGHRFTAIQPAQEGGLSIKISEKVKFRIDPRDVKIIRDRENE